MTWTELPDGEFAQGAPVRGVTGIAMRNNLEAVANGDSGAPKIQADAIAASAITNDKMSDDSVDTSELVAAAVGRSELATSTVSLSGSLPEGESPSPVEITMNAYAFFPMLHTTSNQTIAGHSTDGASPDNPRFAITNSGQSSQSYDVDYRYVVTA